MRNINKNTNKSTKLETILEFMSYLSAAVFAVCAVCAIVLSVIPDKNNIDKEVVITCDDYDKYADCIEVDTSFKRSSAGDVVGIERNIVSEPAYTNEELETFAHLLDAEGGSQGDKCLYYIGSVVLNRVNSVHFPDTLLEVIYQKGQYYPTWHGFMERKVENERCYDIAKDLLENGSVLPANVLGQCSAESIFNKYGSKKYDTVNGEIFFYIKGWE